MYEWENRMTEWDKAIPHPTRKAKPNWKARKLAKGPSKVADTRKETIIRNEDRNKDHSEWESAVWTTLQHSHKPFCLYFLKKMKLIIDFF